MKHMCIYTQAPQFATVLNILKNHAIAVSIHVNRTRFEISTDHPMYSYLALICKDISHETDHALGV